MPELPEVETVRRTLEPQVVGRRVVGLASADFPGVTGDVSPEQVAALIGGRVISGVRRRGKYLLLDFDDGSGLIIHLRMTGVLLVTAAEAPPLRFQRLSVALDDGRELRFADQRKFGRVVYRPADAARGLDAKLGPEPLSPAFNAAYLTARLAGRRAPIKALLLDQRIVAGIGNIYADEALFSAKIHPLRAAGALTDGEAARLVRAVRAALRQGLAHRGTSFSSYRDATGEEGGNQHALRAYGRGRRGEPCPRCGRRMEVVTVAQRSSSICPRCQPLGSS
jgi:formamidopyrimidine-DNA glycosylase